MAENLWEIRRRKRMKVRDLAAKSGVPAAVIHQYEAGEKPVSEAHLRQLARALIVETWDIKSLSDPKPREERTAPKAKPSGEPRPPKPPGPRRPPAPVRPSQITHLLGLAARFADVDRTSLEAKVGKPLEELTAKEAGQLLKELQERIVLEHPPGTGQPFDRHRAYLPEGVDQFEFQYLTAAQKAEHTLCMTLFDGQLIEGEIVGFSPYHITLRQPGGEEITLSKLAIAYYRRQEN